METPSRKLVREGLWLSLGLPAVIHSTRTTVEVLMQIGERHGTSATSVGKSFQKGLEKLRRPSVTYVVTYREEEAEKTAFYGAGERN